MRYTLALTLTRTTLQHTHTRPIGCHYETSEPHNCSVYFNVLKRWHCCHYCCCNCLAQLLMPFASEINKHKSTCTPYISFWFHNRWNADKLAANNDEDDDDGEEGSIATTNTAIIIHDHRWPLLHRSRQESAIRKLETYEMQSLQKSETEKHSEILFSSKSAANLFTLCFNCYMLAAFFIYSSSSFHFAHCAIKNN